MSRLSKVFGGIWVIVAVIIAPLINISLVSYEVYKYFFYWPIFALDKEYKVDGLWTESCWVRSLDKLNELRNDPNIEKMWCVGGQLVTGHMWIAYRTKDKKTVLYDPAFNRTKIK